MSRVGADGNVAGASKKLRVAESEDENEHVVSMIQMVRGACRGILRAHLIFVVGAQGGDRLCQIACNTSISIWQLKAKVEVEAGLKASTLAIYLPEVTQPLGQNIYHACGLWAAFDTLHAHPAQDCHCQHAGY
jgi:hypothetical protein